MCAANNPSKTTKTQSLPSSMLRIISNSSPGAVEHILTRPETSVGHNTACDIGISEDIVSGHHFQVEQRNGLYYLIHPHPLRTTDLEWLFLSGPAIPR